MDIQSQLVQAFTSLQRRHVGHSRHILRLVKQISLNHFVVSMVSDAIKDINAAKFASAGNDIHTARVIDERDNYSLQF